eukprot:m.180708 g.180708  ORF g.180708 m.180708 type:complete len:593 (-) comp15074_c0_seq1:172-1950(-)
MRRNIQCRRGVCAMVAAVGLVGRVAAIDNGLGLLPPMGWRSWNAYADDVNQTIMLTVANAMVATTYGPSLKASGYTHVGLDDAWQAFGMGVGGSFHNASGYPLVNLTRFPSMRDMTDKIHALGLSPGWYANNCGNAEHSKPASWGPDQIFHYEGDVQATIDFGFDGIKLDGCGEFLNLTLWADLFNETGHPVLIENCHWGKEGPGSNQSFNPTADPNWCPFNFFRASSDVQNNWHSLFHNLEFMVPWQPWQYAPWNGDPSSSIVRTGPGCWSYADMLEVGNMPLPVEDRTNFGVWVIASQPLILGHDITNATTNKRIWPFITNPHAIAVSQSYHGHPGSLVKAWLPPLDPPAPTNSYFVWCVHYCPADPTQFGWSGPSIGHNGPIKNGDLCIEAPWVPGHGPVELAMRPCSGSANQTFQTDANGTLFLANNRKAGCLAVATSDSPPTIMGDCDKSSSEMIQFYQLKDGTICSKYLMPPEGPPGDAGPETRGYCLASRDRIPQRSDTRGFEGMIQVWAKPQANGAVAVVVVNGDPTGANHSVVVNLTEVQAAATVMVFDVWGQQGVPGTASQTFTTDAIESHDSRFYVFTPAS